MSTSENVRGRSRRRRTLIATAVVGVLVAVALLTLGVASGRPVAQHRSGDASAAKSAMSSTHQLSRAQGHAAQISRATSGYAAHSSSSGSGSTSSLFKSSLLPNLAPNRSLAATGCGIAGTNFEDADGNLTPETCLDWNSFAPVTWLPVNAAPYQDATKTNGAFTFFGATDAVNDQNDTSYAGGQKQAFDCPKTGVGSVDNKTDLARIYVAETTAANGDEVLYLAWVRGPLNNTSSDVHVGFEFNQGSNLCPAASAPFVHRTDGDILLVYNFTNGGTPTLAFSQWQSGAWTPEVTLPPTKAEAAIFGTDKATTQDDLKPSGAPNPATDEFGEAGVDLTTALAGLGSGGKSCEKFGHAFGESRTSGSSDSAQMKDLVRANINISTCVEPTVTTTLKNAANNNTIPNNSPVALGTSVYDTATFGNLTSGKTPTGTVQYTFFTNGACTGTGTDAGLKTVDGAGNIPQSNTEGPLAAGSYSFEAQYLSDDDPNYVDSEVSGCEPFSVSKAQPGVSTTVVQTPGAGGLGSTAHDTASITGTVNGFLPTGTVTYEFFTNGACTGSHTDQTVALNANGTVPNSAETAALAAGSYGYQAVYSGDSNYLTATGDCEPFSVSKAQPGVSTTVVQTPGAGGLGSTAHDTASITGTVNGFLPTGTVTYEFFTNGACTGSHTDQTVALNANGTVPNSAETAALAAGSYGYQAVYSGDSNYLTATGDCEPFSVSKAQPGVSTTVVQTPGAGGLGSTAHDTASITGTVNGFLPTGTVTYEFFTNGACTGSHTDQTVALNANGTVPNSAETAALAAGSYGYQAVYSGDSNYLTATGDCEPFSVSKAQPGVSTTVVQTPGAGGLGSTAHDTASITGTVNGFLPTGTVTYEFFTNGACTGSHTDQTVALNANGTVPNSAETAALAAGSYGYQAVYSGDSNYLTATGDCEPFSVSKAQPGVSTTVVQTPGAGGLGSTAHDTASITGTVNGFLPTGTVTYEFFTNGACTGSHTDQTVALNANGTVPNSAETAALAAGSYGYQAVYSGDSNYLTATGDCEPFSVSKAQPGVSTTVVQTPGAGGLGSTAHDTASITGTVNGFLPTGTVTYEFFTNGACTGSHTDQTVALNANGTVPNSAETAALAAGSYGYQAVYSGDSNYLTATGDCEPFSVSKAQPGVSTTVFDAATDKAWTNTEQTGATAYDTATITGTVNGFLPTGTVTYEFFTTSTCTGPHADQVVTLNADGSVPNSAQHGPLAAGGYSFQAIYSGDGNYLGATGDCEPFSLGVPPTSTATTVKDHAGNVVDANTPAALGSQVHDTATVSGQVGQIVPTGTVTYHLFSGLDCNVDNEIGSGETVALNGDGSVPISSETDPLQAGSYSYLAVYSGDDNYATSTGPCEPFKVAQADSSTDTVVKDHAGNVVDANTPAALGSQVHDTATVTATPFTATGNLTYHLFSGLDCNVDNEIGSGETVALNGDGSVPNSSETDPLLAGSYSYEAVYEGDSNYNGSTGPCEPFKVAQADSSTDTVVKDHAGNVVDANTPAALGSQVHDTATVTASPFTATGNLTYHLFSGLDCNVDNEIGSGETVALNGDGSVPNSSETDPLLAGSYSYEAVYEGDSNYNGSTGPCEPFKVAQADSSTDTVVKDHAGNVVDANTPAALGSQVHDTATVTASPFTATGNLTYHLFSGLDCNVDNEIGSGETVALNGDGSVPNSSETDPLLAGSYSYEAVYEGDSNYNGSTGPCEPFKVSQGSLTPSTTIKNAADDSTVDGALPLGSKVFDTTQLSGAVEGFDPTGTVSYRFFQNRDCSGEGTSAGSDVSLDGQSDTQGPLGAGDYSFQATYSGDGNYDGATSPCEPLTIGNVTPSASTTLKNAATNATIENGSTLPNGSSVYDTADISNTGGFPLTGTVSFRFFHNGDCSGTPASVQTGVAVGGHSAATGALDEGSYGFQAMYVAGDDPNHNDSAWSACEPFNVQGLVDLAVTKSGSPASQTLGDGNITWTIVVTNHGPDADTGVKITDPMPTGNTFVSATTSKGTCTGGATLNCTIGPMAVDEQVTITLVTTPTAPGTQTNVVSVSGDKPESNTSNNQATASVEVGPFTPPKPCVAVSRVTPKQLFVGRKTALKIHVTQGGTAVKGIHVRIKGPKINVRTTASNSKGIVKQTLKMKKAGVLVFTPIASKACNTKRVGVTNVFTPPVTG